MTSHPPIAAIVFDKDGTLLDFDSTWNAATLTILERLTSGDAELMRGAARDVWFDLETGRIQPGSPLVAESNKVIAALLLPWADPALALDEVGLNQIAANAAVQTLVAMPGADHTLRALHERSIALAIATNDSADGARSTIAELGWNDLFGAAVGYDSGYGAKPAPGMVLGALAELGVSAEAALMVGDSQHDIEAGAAAGARTVRIGPEIPPLGVQPDHHITELRQLLDLI